MNVLTRFVKPRQILRANIIAILLITSLIRPSDGVTYAQEQITRLRITRCNDQNYVDTGNVTCLVVPYESTGVPITNMPAAKFEVRDETGSVDGLTVAETRTLSAPTWVMLAVDMRANPGGKYILNLQTFIPKGLTKDPALIESKEFVGLLAISGKLSAASGPNNIQRDEQRESDFNEDVNTSVNNKIRLLGAQASIPLHEALSKALLLTRQQDYGSRAIVLVTAGMGAQSNNTQIDDLVKRATSFSIPIYVIGMPSVSSQEQGRLQKLASDTFADYQFAGDEAAFVKAYRAIQDKLKTQYTVSFKVSNPSKTDRKLTFRVNLPDGKTASAEYTIKPQAPEKPRVEGVKFLDGANPVALDKFPQSDVVVIPELYARDVSQVTYQIDGGEIVLKEQQPFAYTIKGVSLARGEHTLVLKAYGNKTDPNLITEETRKFTIVASGPTAVITPSVAPTPDVVPTPIPPVTVVEQIMNAIGDMSLLMLILLFVGVAAVVVLLIWIISSLISKRRATNMGPITDVITNAFPTGVDYTGVGEPPTFGGSMGRVNDDPTQIFPDSAGESPKTQILQASKAMLEILNGESKGEIIPLGAAGKNIVYIGRDADTLAGDVQLRSKFISRQHAEIHIDGDAMYLIDCGSASGTKLNGQKLEKDVRHRLEIGMDIGFADINTRVNKVE